MSDAPHVRLDHRPDGVAVLTFDQPDSRANVLTPRMWADFEAAVDAVAARADVRGLVLASGKPGVFIAGADLHLLLKATGPNDPAVRAFIEHGLRVLAKLEALPVPTCAAIDGAAVGGGLEVALACDARVCGDGPKVRLGLPETTLGLIPGWGGTQRLPRLVGMEAAAMALATGRDVLADMTADLGAESRSLTERLEPGEDAVEEAARFLKWGWQRTKSDEPLFLRRRRRVRGPVPEAERQVFRPQMSDDASAAVCEAVRVMVEGAALPLVEGIAVETAAFLRLAGSDESRRRIAAFFAGRKGG